MKAEFQWLYSAACVLCIWKSCKLHATGHSINHVKGYYVREHSTVNFREDSDTTN